MGAFALDYGSIRANPGTTDAWWRPEVATVDLVDSEGPRRVVAGVWGNVRMLTRREGVGRELLSQWSAPEILSTSVGFVFAVEFAGGWLWVSSDHDLKVFDVSDPRRPATTPRMALPEVSFDFANASGVVFATGSTSIHSFRSAEGETPRRLDSVDVPGTPVTRLSRDGDRLWFVSRTDGAGSLIGLVDVSDPEQLRLETTFESPEVVYALDAEGDRLALLSAPSTSLGPDTLELLDVRDPTDPRLLGALDVGYSATTPPAVQSIGDVELAGSEVLVAHVDTGLVRIDASTPAHLRERGRSRIAGMPFQIVEDEGVYWIATRYGGVSLVSLEPDDDVQPHVLWLPIARR